MNNQFAMISNPVYKWRVRINPTFTLAMADAPCLFWRTAQRLVLGFKWERIK